MTSPHVQEIITEMGAVIGSDCGLGGTVKFDFGDAGSVLVDGLSRPNTVSDGNDKGADCTITVSLETFEKMVAGEIDGTNAFMMGLLQVAGDMVLAMKIGPILERSRK